MKKVISALIFSFVFSFAFAQSEVNMYQIMENTKSKKSNLYYSKLLPRFIANDTLLTTEEYIHLYYGTFFQKKFKWYANNRWQEITQLINEKKNKEALQYCDSMLGLYPVNSKLIRLKYEILNSIDSTSKEISILKNKYNKLLDVISKSGSGKSESSPFYVIYISDEYEYLFNFLKIDEFQMQSFQMPLDYMCFKKNQKPECLYFYPLKK